MTCAALLPPFTRNLRWVCEEGHPPWHAPLRKVRDEGYTCPACENNSDLERSRRILESYWQPLEFVRHVGKDGVTRFEYVNTNPRLRFPYSRPEFLCRAKAARAQELDGYCEALGVAFEQLTEDPASHRRALIKQQRCAKRGVLLLIAPLGDPGPSLRSQIAERGFAMPLRTVPIIRGALQI